MAPPSVPSLPAVVPACPRPAWTRSCRALAVPCPAGRPRSSVHPGPGVCRALAPWVSGTSVGRSDVSGRDDGRGHTRVRPRGVTLPWAPPPAAGLLSLGRSRPRPRTLRGPAWRPGCPSPRPHARPATRELQVVVWVPGWLRRPHCLFDTHLSLRTLSLSHCLALKAACPFLDSPPSPRSWATVTSKPLLWWHTRASCPLSSLSPPIGRYAVDRGRPRRRA